MTHNNHFRYNNLWTASHITRRRSNHPFNTNLIEFLINCSNGHLNLKFKSQHKFHNGD